MITLHGFGRAFGLADPSPFVTKAEVLLRMSGLPFERKPSNPAKGPKGKIPWIVDDGVAISDSTFIRWHLEKKHGINFNAGYSPAEIATGWAFEKMLEDHTYWTVISVRWLNDDNFNKGPRIFFNPVPALIRPLVCKMIRKKVAKNLHAQGTGRHTDADIARLGIADVDAVAAFLGDKPFLLGNEPCGSDATVYAFAASALCKLFDSRVRDAAEGHANLVAYVARCQKRFFPEGF